LNIICLHLGNGASAAAIAAGKCIDTSMGLTPLAGLMMGTRCGDIDPAIIFYMLDQGGWSAARLDSELNTASGLKGVCGVNDMREAMTLAENGDAGARLAVEMYCYRVKKYIGAYTAALGHVDAIVFTAGIGENSAEIRARSVSNLDRFGIALDERLNAAPGRGIREIQTGTASVRLLVIPTDEELSIARQTAACIAG
jgi:acetate kinase